MTAYTPNLPTLIAQLPGDHTRAPQTEFTRARQVLFVENLSTTGSARSASAAAGVSHQSAYRARRSCAQFRLAWDAALVAARQCAEDTLACRAIDGVTEEMRYHGEVVGTRTRYSDRLLLAHLARLDRLEDDGRAAAFAEDWDAGMARFAAGDEPLAGEGPIFSSGPCNSRSKSNSDLASGEAADEAARDDACEYEWDDDGIDWLDDEAAEAELDRIHAAMEADRPADAPRLTGEGADDPNGLIADAQMEAFARGVPRWWLVIPPDPPRGSDAWHYADVEADVETEAEAEADTEAGAELAPPPAPSDQPERWNDDRTARDSEPEPEPQPKSKPEQEVEHKFEPQPDPAPQPQPDQALASTPASTPRDDRARWAWAPVNDGRLQPFHGRYF